MSSLSNQSQESVTRRPRGSRSRSPVSLFSPLGYGIDAPKEPKPLAKLEPKGDHQTKGGSSSLSSLKLRSKHSPSSSFDSQMSASSSKDKRSKSGSSGSVFSLGRRKSLIKTPPPPPLTLPTSPSPRSLKDRPKSIANPPDSASLIIPTEDEIKRHQLAKACRMLGEDIPPSLIYGGSNNVSRDGSVLVHRRSLSSSSFPILDSPIVSSPLFIPTPPSSNPSSPSSQRFRRPKTAPSPKPSISDDPHSLNGSQPKSVIPPINVHPSLDNLDDVLPLEDQKNLPPRSHRSTDPSSSSSQPSTLRRARTFKPLTISTPSTPAHTHSHSDDLKGRLDTPFANSINFDNVRERPETPFVDTLIPTKNAYLTTNSNTWSPSSNKPTERRERKEGWSGEWNREDMQDVISKLRNLK